MIQKHVIGRLGNQMFQYATVRAFQIKNRPNDEILLDFSEVYEKIVLVIKKNFHILILVMLNMEKQKFLLVRDLLFFV